MKKFSVALMTFASLLAFPSVSLADCQDNYCTAVTIDKYYVYNSVILIGTSGTESNLTCELSKDGDVILRDSHPHFNTIAALLLTAHESRNKIRLIVPSSGSCDIVGVVSIK